MVGKRAVLDFDECDRMWNGNKDHGNRGSEHYDDPKVDTDTDEGVSDSPKMKFNEVRTKREKYLAELARLEYLEKAGRLVDSEKVKAEAFKQARVARDNLMNIPDRVAPLVVGRTEIHEIRKILVEEIHKVCEAIADA